MIRDKNIEYKYMNLWLGAQVWDKNLLFTDAGDAGELLTEVNSVGMMGWQFDGGDDEVYYTLPTPTYIDWDNDVYYRVIYAVDSEASGQVETFTLSASETAFGVLPSASAPTAFLTLSDTAAATGVALATPWQSANSETEEGIAGTSDLLRLYVKNTTEDDTQQAYMLGLEIRYLPKLTSGPQVSNQPAPTDA